MNFGDFEDFEDFENFEDFEDTLNLKLNTMFGSRVIAMEIEIF